MAPPVLSLCEKESGRDSVGCFFCDAADDFARFSCCICERRYRSTTGTGLKLPLAAEVTNVRFGPEGAVEAHMAKALKAPLRPLVVPTSCGSLRPFTVTDTTCQDDGYFSAEITIPPARTGRETLLTH